MLPKGVRDFLPKEMILRNKLINKIKSVFELYGFSPLETPVFEKMSVLGAKFAAGEESDALKETFKVIRIWAENGYGYIQINDTKKAGAKYLWTDELCLFQISISGAG